MTTDPHIAKTFTPSGKLRAAINQGNPVLAGRFMVIEQALGCSKALGEAAAAYLSAFVETMKSSGFVTQALQRHSIQGATVAP